MWMVLREGLTSHSSSNNDLKMKTFTCPPAYLTHTSPQHFKDIWPPTALCMCMYSHVNACSRQGRSFRGMFGLYLLLTVLSCESASDWKLIVFSTFDDKNSEAQLCSPNPRTETLSSVFIFQHGLRKLMDTDQTLQYQMKLWGQCWAWPRKHYTEDFGEMLQLLIMLLAEVDVEV